jgi:hypothetical protein
MRIIIVENPPESFIYSKNEIMKIVFITSVISIELLDNLIEEGFIVEEIVHRIGYLFDIEINITLEIFVANGVKNVISSTAFL